jgi:hypothetical protein
MGKHADFNYFQLYRLKWKKISLTSHLEPLFETVIIRNASLAVLFYCAEGSTLPNIYALFFLGGGGVNESVFCTYIVSSTPPPEDSQRGVAIPDGKSPKD